LVMRTTVAWIEGAQSQGVYATVKHFAANNQEGVDPTGGQTANGSSPLGVGFQGSRHYENSVVDQRTLREVYVPQFEAAVKEAHVGAVMCSYNRLNGAYACANQRLLNQILKGEWGFKNMVMSDWILAAHPTDTISNLNNGLALEMPFADSYNPTAVQAAMAANQASSETVDDHVRRLLRTLFAFGFFDRDADGSDATTAAAAARAADVAVVFVGDYETEGADRACLTLECPNNGDQDGLVEAVAAAQPNTVVVLETGGPVLTPWRDKVSALVEA